mgnify:CR=1 FL=1
MQAIAHAVLEKNPETRLQYFGAEQFINDVIESIHARTMSEFRRRYRDLAGWGVRNIDGYNTEIMRRNRALALRARDICGPRFFLYGGGGCTSGPRASTLAPLCSRE